MLRRELDWVAKLRSRGLPHATPRWDAPAARVDLQYSDVRPDKASTTGSARGRSRHLTDAEVERAVVEPPEDTRAYFRGRCIAQYPDEVGGGVVGLGHLRPSGQDSLQRVPMMEPLRAPRRTSGRCSTGAHGRRARPLDHRRLRPRRRDGCSSGDRAAGRRCGR
jgi:proteasome accessory factor A